MKVVIYYRVSTKKQKHSGLGLEAQKQTAKQYVESNNSSVVAEYQEIESGRNCGRPVLKEALEHARLTRATLLVAKLDRLARNVAFVSTLMESQVPFICCDNPHATPLTIHIMAAFAEDEAKRASTRTKEGLAAARAKGKKLGTHNPKIYRALANNRGWEKNSLLGREVRANLQKSRYGHIIPVIKALQAAGPISLRRIAEYLNDNSYVTSRGTPFTACTVSRILERERDLMNA